MIFRLILSLVMFGLLLGGIYSAYKHFSGLDPLKLDLQVPIRDFLQVHTPQEFLAAISSVKLNTGLPVKIDTRIISQPKETAKPADPKKLFSFLLLSDSHSDNLNLRKAITQAKNIYPDLRFIIGTGDFTEIGTLDEFKKVKVEFDLSTLRYFLLPGDHDLWDSRDKQQDPAGNFRSIFGPTYQSFTYKNFRFILLFNSDNYAGMREDQINWLTTELQRAKEEQSDGVFVFLHEPLYHPSSDHVMGKVEKSLKTQAKNISFQLKTNGVKKVFAGDSHYFSEYEEPESKLPMVTVGAVTIDRNPQAPRYAIVSVFEDGSSGVEDIEIK